MDEHILVLAVVSTVAVTIVVLVVVVTATVVVVVGQIADIIVVLISGHDNKIGMAIKRNTRDQLR